MMYSEFAKGTGCKDNEHNHKVFENLEAMYMNTNMTKEEVYEYGKKLVDNSKSEEELRIERKVLEEIEELKDEINWYKEKIDMYERFIKFTPCSFEEERNYKRWIKEYREMIKRNRAEIKSLKWILN